MYHSSLSRILGTVCLLVMNIRDYWAINTMETCQYINDYSRSIRVVDKKGMMGFGGWMTFKMTLIFCRASFFKNTQIYLPNKGCLLCVLQNYNCELHIFYISAVVNRPSRLWNLLCNVFSMRVFDLQKKKSMNICLFNR